MGDVASSEPLGAEVDAAKIAEAAEAAFSPNEALTAAFVVAHKGRIISERYSHFGEPRAHGWGGRIILKWPTIDPAIGASCTVTRLATHRRPNVRQSNLPRTRSFLTTL
jgi:hypothetical protein